MASFEDFDLRIWAEGDQYMAQVMRSPIGASDPAVWKWPFEQSHRELRLELENAILRGRLRNSRGAVSPHEKKLRDFGGDMFKSVFTDAEPIARRFNGSLEFVDNQPGQFEGLRVKLMVEPPELAVLPWEYVFDETSRDPARTYISLSSRSPLVRFHEATARAFQAITAPLNVLGMIADPGGEWEKLDFDKEKHGIETAIDKIENSKQMVNLRWVNGHTVDDLLDMLTQGDWHVFHFIGHGGTDPVIDDDGTRHTEGYLVFGDGKGGAKKITPTQLARILRTAGHLRLAVLNCCDSGCGASPGEALVRSGIAASVAMQFPVSNEAAVSFASRFYNALVTGQTVEKALTIGRVAMQVENPVEWGIPVLFTRMGADLFFDVKRPPHPVPVEPTPSRPVPLLAVTPQPAPPKEDHDARRRNAQAALRRLLPNA
ncbi:hypothetical protein ASC95_14325 [Pelomonas sp. Root1217]|nr:hypothetical protein ASC95_14325 [Pelomonas sp. Root1217]